MFKLYLLAVLVLSAFSADLTGSDNQWLIIQYYSSTDCSTSTSTTYHAVQINRCIMFSASQSIKFTSNAGDKKVQLGSFQSNDCTGAADTTNIPAVSAMEKDVTCLKINTNYFKVITNALTSPLEGDYVTTVQQYTTSDCSISSDLGEVTKKTASSTNSKCDTYSSGSKSYKTVQSNGAGVVSFYSTNDCTGDLDASVNPNPQTRNSECHTFQSLHYKYFTSLSGKLLSVGLLAIASILLVLFA